MSRPGNPQMVVERCQDCVAVGFHVREASPADLLAAVRRGVESGTIEGRELDWLDPDNEGQFRRVLVIPVSDGGSET